MCIYVGVHRVFFTNRFVHSAKPLLSLELFFSLATRHVFVDICIVLGVIWSSVWLSWIRFGASWAPLNWGLLGGSQGPLGAIFGPLGAILGPLGTVLGVMLPQVNFRKKIGSIL